MDITDTKETTHTHTKTPKPVAILRGYLPAEFVRRVADDDDKNDH